VNRGLQLHDKSEQTNLLHTPLNPRVVIHYVFLRFTFTIPWSGLMLAKWPLGAFSSPILAVLRLD
jgi:hypothetical protein